ncbi:MAG: hypothetical protein U5R31_08635 [Acidimicrobiia bacterium]|nr:hypothetical protein [Acidimicrobiia bacterium]
MAWRLARIGAEVLTPGFQPPPRLTPKKIMYSLLTMSPNSWLWPSTSSLCRPVNR